MIDVYFKKHYRTLVDHGGVGMTAIQAQELTGIELVQQQYAEPEISEAILAIGLLGAILKHKKEKRTEGAND
jgi:hypothetical protein